MTMLSLDMKQVLHFLNLLDKDARHTIASEHPTARNGMPKWEVGATFESYQKQYLIRDITERQERGSNVYYSVNRPCKVTERQGVYGKNNIDDIIAIRALAFDIDVLADQDIVLTQINEKLNGEFYPSMVISTGGGYHLIYLLNELINVRLHRPPKNDDEKEINEIIIYNRSCVTELARDFESMFRGIFPNWKIDNMSNVDRVMRLPGTINFPKLEKQVRGQKREQAKIILENSQRVDIHKLRSLVPKLSEERPQFPKKPFTPPKNYSWTGYLKAKACCEFIRDNGLADTNEWYTHNVMLPLIGAVHDENEHNSLTLAEAEELFMMAISGGARYGTLGRGPGYFMRQWRSHRPELPPRYGNKSMGGLIWAAKNAGMELPWAGKIVWNESFARQLAELRGEEQIVPDDISRDFSSD